VLIFFMVAKGLMSELTIILSSRPEIAQKNESMGELYKCVVSKVAQ
jgi:hypothetical protein